MKLSQSAWNNFVSDNISSPIQFQNLYRYHDGFREIPNSSVKKYLIGTGLSDTPSKYNELFYPYEFDITSSSQPDAIQIAYYCSNKWTDWSSHFNRGYTLQGSTYSGIVYYLGQFNYINSTKKGSWWIILAKDVTGKSYGDLQPPVAPFEDWWLIDCAIDTDSNYERYNQTNISHGQLQP